MDNTVRFQESADAQQSSIGQEAMNRRISGLRGTIPDAAPKDCTEAQRPMTTAEHRMWELKKRAYRAQSDSIKLDRVLEILNRHPEFHEFLEVIQSGLV